MADLKDLQEMVKSGEFSKKLLEDEKFKNEIKKILKEANGIEITDEDIPEVVKNLEENLKEVPDEEKIKQVLSETKLENVSGGVSKAKVIKGVSTIAGAALGARLGYKGTYSLLAPDYDLQKDVNKAKELYNKEVGPVPQDSIPDEEYATRLENFKTNHAQEYNTLAAARDYYKKPSAIPLVGNTVGGGILGLGVGYVISDYLCDKFNIK